MEDILEFPGLRQYFEEGAQEQYVINDVTKDMAIPVNHHLSPRSVQLLLAGGLLNYIKANA